MKQHILNFGFYILIATFGIVSNVYSQEGTSLKMQGLNYYTNQSTISRAMGGVTVGLKNEPTLMYLNPAMLTSISGVKFSVGGYWQKNSKNQNQQFGTLQGHAGAVFLFQGITSQIPDPDFSLVTKRRLTQEDSIQRPFDNLGPYWSREKNFTLPLQFFAVSPFKVGDYKVVVGIGAVEYANLYWYYCNNNALSPNVLDVATYGTIRTQNLPRNDTIVTATKPYPVYWNKYYQYRNGSINGYGGAVAVELSPRFSLGVSGMYLDGETTDEEGQQGRGRMLFFYNSIRLDKYGMTTYKTRGKSTYSGFEFIVSGTYTSPYIQVGFSLKPPTTLERKFNYSYWKDSVAATKRLDSKADSIHIITTSYPSGNDKMELPLRGSLGIAITIKENILVAFEYEVNPYASATYIAPNGISSKPWLSSSTMKFGAEWNVVEWLKLRGGMRQVGEVFQPATNPLRGENVKYPVYSLGCGVTAFGATLNITYEYSDRRYTDTWSNAASINHQYVHTIVADMTYQLPFLLW
ncbi:MAG: hypothetical protein N3A63_02790 [Bacteroidetes bacterium]|nr:hypothetical protein [Bacteroidota bacterium]